MSPEFKSILLQAGDWACDVKLKQARWNKDTSRLEITLSTSGPFSQQQKDTLLQKISEHFTAFSICLKIEQGSEEPVNKDTNIKAVKADNKIIYGKRIAKSGSIPLVDLNDTSGSVVIEGCPLSIEHVSLNKGNNGMGRTLVSFGLTDYTNTIMCKVFLGTKKDALKLANIIEKANTGGDKLRIKGDCQYDRFQRDLAIMVDSIELVDGYARDDTMKKKRVELHLHTQMSAMDGVANITKTIERAAKWGHTALAVTDHGVAQAFPEAAKAGKKHGVKILFGVEGYLLPDADFLPMEQTYVVFDIETTGLKPETSQIIEIGAVKIQGEKIIDTFSTFINAGTVIPPKITELTGITDDMIKGAPFLKDTLISFREFSKGCVLVAHNASFDVGFIRYHAQKYDIGFDEPYGDTLMLSRYLLFGLANYKLDTVCKYLDIPLVNHHRAVEDANATAEMLMILLKRMKQLNMQEIPLIANKPDKQKRIRPNHVVLLAQTAKGLKNLYRIISNSHIHFFNAKHPQIPRSLLCLYREGILVGSACVKGELFEAILQNKSEQELCSIAQWYDYLEIQPICNNEFLIRENKIEDYEGLKNLNRRVVEIGKKTNKIVVATGDVHFLDPQDAAFRAIIQHFEGYKDASNQGPLYYRTTKEMLDEFAYLGEDEAYEVVVNASNAIADSCEKLMPYPEGTFAPKLPNAENELRDIALTRAKEVYGDILPDIVQRRMDKELNSIINNGFASLYIVAMKLVQKSLMDGYLVGSRGSVGSSLVATMANITEVNPLPPHYVCPQCKNSDFDVDKSKYACGIDVPDKNCPKCGAVYNKEGFDIPFEVFLGFDGDKTPDIDLNFSGEYQPIAHKYTEEMFGLGHAYRAGTISSVQQKTAYGFVKKYAEENGITLTKMETERLCKGCNGVKRTTGQHPGGIVIVPEDNDILNFTPVQYPSDQQEKGTITTHFDFHALDDRLVKLDILGHVDPTALRALQDITGLDPRTIPLDDKETLDLYSSSKNLKADISALDGCDVGSLALPEFGTPFVRQMLKETRPSTMEELVRIAGLSHGTDVWINNAQNLIREGKATLFEAICTRDDIMTYLIAAGCEESLSFKIMENVRKGKGLTQDMRIEMNRHGVPEWYIQSCEKINYMFPRAHAVAYVMMSFRIAYYKMHYPAAFYAVYFSERADVFDAKAALGGAQKVLGEIKAIKAKGKEAAVTEIDLIAILEVVYEMNMRGISLLPLDIYKSHATKFLVEESNAIRLPFSAISGIGNTAALSIASRIKSEPYISIEDFQRDTGANNAQISAMEEIGCFKDIPKTNQISMF